MRREGVRRWRFLRYDVIALGPLLTFLLATWGVASLLWLLLGYVRVPAPAEPYLPWLVPLLAFIVCFARLPRSAGRRTRDALIGAFQG